MLQELVNYAEWLKKDFKEFFEGGVIYEGFHIKVEIDKKGNRKKIESEIYQKDQYPNKFLKEIAKIENRYEMVPIYIIKNKYVDSRAKFFTSNNCYSLFFPFFKSKDNDLKIAKAFTFKGKNSSEIKENKLEDFVNNHKLYLKLDNHFNNLKEIIDCNIECENCCIYKYINQNFKEDLIKEFSEKFIECKNGLRFLREKELLKDLKVFLVIEVEKDCSIPNIDFQIKNYLRKRLPLKKENNEEIGEFIFSPILNQDNEKKIFSRHKTFFAEKNKKIRIDEANILIKLLKLAYEEKLPNPLPIFIDKDDLNRKTITIFRNNDEKIGHKEIIASLVKNYDSDIYNYYLLNYFKGKTLTIHDFDYVPSFKFYLDESYNINNLGVFDINIKEKIENIFDIETLLDGVFFFKVNRKTGRKEEILKTNYFSDKIDPQKGWEIPGFILNNLYKYRKTIYDAIYKSRLYLITPQIVKEVCLPVIRYEISHDETDVKTKKSKNEKYIIEKILKYFALNKIFDRENKNTGGIDMPSKLPEYYKNLKELLKEPPHKELDKETPSDLETFKSDEDFAFGLGQLIRYLLELSESGNKNHSMFNPFLQKLNNYELFIEFLMKTFQTYSHKIKMHYRIFDKLMSDILAYKPEKKLKDLEVIIMAGYFADSVIEKLIKELSNTDNENKKEGK